MGWWSLLLKSTEVYSEPSTHYNKAFLLKQLTALCEYIWWLPQPVLSCSNSTMQRPEQSVKSVQS